MPLHQRQGPFLCQQDQFFTLAFLQDQRLFHKDVLGCQKRLAGQGIVGFCGRGIGQCLDFFARQNLVQSQTGLCPRMFFSELLQNDFVLVTDEPQHAQFIKDADQVLPPIARAHNGDIAVAGILVSRHT